MYVPVVCTYLDHSLTLLTVFWEAGLLLFDNETGEQLSRIRS